MKTDKIIKVIQEVHEQFKGGSGSGNFGHGGRPGKVGGSAGGGGGSAGGVRTLADVDATFSNSGFEKKKLAGNDYWTKKDSATQRYMTIARHGGDSYKWKVETRLGKVIGTSTADSPESAMNAAQNRANDASERKISSNLW